MHLVVSLEGAKVQKSLSFSITLCGFAPCTFCIFYLDYTHHAVLYSAQTTTAALVFIDKYTQVPRILAPIVQCIEKLPALVDDTAFHSYVSQEWGSIDGLRLQILSDFFKHGFDGSGKAACTA